MEKQQKKIIVIIAIMILSFVIITFALQQKEPTKSVENKKSIIPEERVIATFGQDTGATGQQIVRNKPALLDEIINKSSKDMDPYLYPNGPVIGYGKDMKGSMIVMIDENWTLNQTMINKIYEHIAARGRESGADTVPCRFIFNGNYGTRSIISQDNLVAKRIAYFKGPVSKHQVFNKNSPSFQSHVLHPGFPGVWPLVNAG